MKPRNTYDECADQYVAMVQERNECFDSDPLAPAFFDLIGDVDGLKALDAGCGEGFVARELTARGAEVTAIDISAPLVKVGRSKDAEGKIDYRVCDLSEPLPEFEGHFDLVASHVVLNDVPDFRGFIRTIGSLTTPDARAVFSLNNPYSAFRREKATSYFASGEAVIYQGMAGVGVEVYYYHRTMEEYITAFRESGFLLRSLVDIPPPKDMPPHEKWNEIPPLMVLEFVKR